MDEVNSSISIEEDEEDLSNLMDDEINVHFDFSVWNCFRRFITLENLQTLRQQSLVCNNNFSSSATGRSNKPGGESSRQLPPLHEEGSDSSDDNDNDNNQRTQNDDIDYTKKELTNEEKLDNATWRLRLAADHVFSKLYVPNEQQKREMEAIAEMLALLNLASNPGYLVGVISIYYDAYVIYTKMYR